MNMNKIYDYGNLKLELLDKETLIKIITSQKNLIDALEEALKSFREINYQYSLCLNRFHNFVEETCKENKNEI